jgi:2'-hydroxyisoflavone reductase
MTTDRRSFLRLSALAGGAVATGSLGASPLAAASALYRGLPDVPAAPRTLDLLILGGTGFTGPHQVRYAVARGHRVTVFNRGRSDADLPPGVEQRTGDRNLGQVDALRGGSWDAVIDNPTTLPFWVRDAGEVLNDATGQYVFISTISTYDASDITHLDEDSPLAEFPDEGDPLDVTPEMYQEAGGRLYGPLKVASEREAARWYGDRTTIIRPGLIVGPGDQTDRFTYWPLRVERGGEILAPGDGSDPVQVIDARDLAEWTIRMVENGTTGTFNATGPRATLTMAEQLHGIRGALSGDIDLRFTWVPAEFLQERSVRPWSEMTTWFGPGDILSQASIARALAAGLTFRPLATTTTDVLDWFRTLPAERRAQPRAGLAPEKERDVLAAWRARAGSGG